MSLQDIANKIPQNLFYKAETLSDLVPLTINQLIKMNSDNIISSKINDEKKTVMFSEEYMNKYDYVDFSEKNMNYLNDMSRKLQN